jgi:hypothetical protein
MTAVLLHARPPPGESQILDADVPEMFVSLDHIAELPDEGETPEEQCFNAIGLELVQRAVAVGLSKLPPRRRDVVRRRLGLEGCDIITLKALADEYERAPERIRQEQAKGERQLAQYICKELGFNSGSIRSVHRALSNHNMYYQSLTAEERMITARKLSLERAAASPQPDQHWVDTQIYLRKKLRKEQLKWIKDNGYDIPPKPPGTKTKEEREAELLDEVRREFRWKFNRELSPNVRIIFVEPEEQEP